MKILVHKHNLEIAKTPVNEQEVNATEIEFEFDEEITNEFTKEAYFTLNGGKSYVEIINQNKCSIPSEVLAEKGQIELGVVAYTSEPYVRYNPTPVYFDTWKGSLKDAENSEAPTPSEAEQLVSLVDDALTDLQDKVDSGYFKGDKGDTGATGPQGPEGPAGKDGKDGIDGKDGKDGVDGKNGIDGKDGVDGQNGADGRDGVIQYTAGDNITIENNVISASGGDAFGTHSPKYKIQNVDNVLHTYFYTDGAWSEGLGASGTDFMVKVLNDYKEHYVANATNNIKVVTITKDARAEMVINGLTSATLGQTYYIEFVNTKNYAREYYQQYKMIPTYTNGVCTAVSITSSGYPTLTFIGTGNNVSYTPTDDYHPATKKYVDDAVAGAGGGSDAIVIDYYDTTANKKLKLQQAYEEYLDTGSFLLIEKNNGTAPPYFLTMGYADSSWANFVGYSFNDDVTTSGNISVKPSYKYVYECTVSNGQITEINANYEVTGYMIGFPFDSWTGWDDSKTQVLKNVNGSIMWVDE